LSSDADVTLFVSTIRHDDMATPSVRAQSLFDDRDVKIVFVDEPAPEEVGSHFGYMHRYSARVFEALQHEYGSRGPDLIEFQDYLGEAAVTIQARVTRDRFLADTPVLVRLNTTAEMCALLDGYEDRGMASEYLRALERYSLRFADRLLYGGGDIYELYQRLYGARALAPGVRVRQPLGAAGPIAWTEEVGAPDGGPLRLLYLGRLERRKGVAQLMKAMSVLRADVKLTLVGGDTETAPLGTWMRRLLEEMILEDPRGEAIQPWDPRARDWPTELDLDYLEPRIEIIDHLRRADLPALIDRHHVGVFPSLWECWPAVALEMLSRNRPIIATPVGGLAEMAQPGRSGWLTRSNDDPFELARTIEQVADDRDALREMIESRSPRRIHEELCDGEGVREWYLEVARRGRLERRRRAHPSARPLVSAIVPYHALPRHVEDTVASLLAQTYPEVEVIIVNDGSFHISDRVIGRIAARLPVRVAVQPNSGLGAARNFGVKISRGRYVALLDADNLFEPSFIERAVDVLEADPEIVYVSCWSRYIDDRGIPQLGPGAGFQPISNFPEAGDVANVAGDAAALIRRSVFDCGHWYSEELTSYEDWEFYRRLREAGMIGHCIPERLLRYRIRPGSMIREVGFPELERLEREVATHLRSREVAWTSPSG
jgi:glycosyltransferase involved in cell wall biosynthesis